MKKQPDKKILAGIVTTIALGTISAWLLSSKSSRKATKPNKTSKEQKKGG